MSRFSIHTIYRPFQTFFRRRRMNRLWTELGLGPTRWCSMSVEGFQLAATTRASTSDPAQLNNLVRSNIALAGIMGMDGAPLQGSGLRFGVQQFSHRTSRHLGKPTSLCGRVQACGAKLLHPDAQSLVSHRASLHRVLRALATAPNTAAHSAPFHALGLADPSHPGRLRRRDR